MSWLLGGLGVVGLLLAGRTSTRGIGWVVGIGAQALWIVYAIASHQPGFIMSAVAFGIAYGVNLRVWLKDSGWMQRAHQARVIKKRAEQIVEEGRHG